MNMTDKELLEKAAKAAGVKIDKSATNGGGSWNTGFDLNGDAVLDWHSGLTWNPLRNDGDAFRLAVNRNLFGNPLVDHYLALERLANPKIADGPAYKRAFTRAAAHLADEQDAG